MLPIEILGEATAYCFLLEIVTRTFARLSNIRNLLDKNRFQAGSIKSTVYRKKIKSFYLFIYFISHAVAP